MKRVFEVGRRFLREEDGATTTEYGLLVAFVAVALLVVLTPFKNAVARLFSDATTALGKAP
jgi:Flp pilus assembly pilin Flp